MKKSLQSIVLLLLMTLLPMTANGYEQLADGVYCDGSTLYIGSNVTSLGPLQANPSVIYCYATIPPACVSNTFESYNATLHVPTAAMVNYFTAQYWYNFTNVQADAVEPLEMIISQTSAQVEKGKQFSLSASIIPSDAIPNTVSWYSTDTTVATVNGGKVTAVNLGECDIIAWCADKQAVCHVIVLPERVTITLDQHEARLLPNHLLTLIATCSPISTDLVVTSSDSTVALPRLVNGTIQVLGVKEGTATVRVGSVDGTANTDACMVTVYTEVGDVNMDGYVTISDVTALIDHLLGSDVDTFSVTNADTNRDSNVSISDVTMLIDYLLGAVDLNTPVTETFTVNGVSFTMVAVEGGTFTMGATAEQGSDAYDSEKPAHEVTLSSYYIGQTEVTQALWQAVMGSNPSYWTSANGYTDDMQCPVECVWYTNWYDNCQTFISKLNELTGKTFRLPTEAEWEYAARGGNRSQGYKYAGSNDINEVAWYGEGFFGPMPVGSKSPNELGLYDMSGNVREWCQDWYGSYSSEAQTNPTGPASGSGRVTRGGGWYDNARFCRVSDRGFNYAWDVPGICGLRLAL